MHHMYIVKFYFYFIFAEDYELTLNKAFALINLSKLTYKYNNYSSFCITHLLSPLFIFFS